LNIAIVDDLAADLKILENALAACLSGKLFNYKITSFTGGAEFLSAYRPGLFDAVFLDNLMEGMSGMETAHALRKYDSRIPIIFATTEEGFALEGYSVQAMDYILKPITPERLEPLIGRLTHLYKPLRYIEIRENRFDRKLLLDDIQYVRSVGHFLEIHTPDQTLKPYMTLENLLALLKQLGEYGGGDGMRFQNCCRGYVVNLDHVLSLKQDSFLLAGGETVPVSRPRHKEMQAAYASYLFAKTRQGL